MRMTTLLLGLTLPFLMSCASSTVRGDSASTDLRLIALGVKALTEPTRVEGPIQTRDQAETNGELWLLSGRQEDALGLANRDKARVRLFTLDALETLRAARQPDCRWWDWRCWRARSASSEIGQPEGPR